MVFTWNMTETQWKNYMKDHLSHSDEHLSEDADVYRSVSVGKLCIEFLHSLDESAWYPYANFFCLGRNTGYGYKDGYPYDLLDNDIKVPMECDSFDSFKKEVEKRIELEILDGGLTAEAETENMWVKEGVI